MWLPWTLSNFSKLSRALVTENYHPNQRYNFLMFFCQHEHKSKLLNPVVAQSFIQAESGNIPTYVD